MPRFVKRRCFLTYSYGLLVAPFAGCIDTLGIDSENALKQVGVESLHWEGTTLVIEFNPTFDEWDGWVIHHEYEDPGSYRLVGGEYPRVDNPQRLPFVTLLQKSLADSYSTTTFEITSFNGMADPWDDEYGSGVVAWSEFGPSASFDAPTDVLERAGVME